MKRFTTAAVAFLVAGTMAASAYEVHNLEGLCDTIDERIEAKQDVTDREETYGFILNGDGHELHRRNVSLGYQGMRDMGIPAENIYILSVPDNGTYSDLGDALVGRSQKEQVETIFMDKFPDLVDETDTAIVYITGHGHKASDDTIDVLLSGVRLPAEYYAYTIDNMDAKKTVSIVDTCYSGSFIRPLEEIDDSYIALSSTQGARKTCCDAFAQSVWRSLDDYSLDLDNDGAVSFEEVSPAVQIAHKEHIMRYHPDFDGEAQYKTNIDR
jgi:hypothetical protein